MPKFFVDKCQVLSNNITVTGDDVNHISRVLRMQSGDELTVCDKEGMDYFCEIEKITKEEVLLKINDKKACPAEPETKVTLYQCIPKSGKMDSIIQKAVELGVYEIVPVLSKRCVAKGEKSDRWQKISFEAAKQCGRGIIPIVHPAMNFKEAVKSLSEKDLALFPYEEATDGSLRNIPTDVKSVGIIVGPEGGFDKGEVEEGKKLGARIITLGKRILRTETAGSTVISIVMSILGEME